MSSAGSPSFATGRSREDGALTYVGPASGLQASAPMRLAEDVTVVPGFVDAHTHLPFLGWRADEFEARLAGRSYRELHSGGGIPRSARMLAEASDEQVLAFCLPLVREMLDVGTTAVEFKTGYGLSVEGELRQARLARRLGELAPQTCMVTLLACHAILEVSIGAVGSGSREELIPEASAEDSPTPSTSTSRTSPSTSRIWRRSRRRHGSPDSHCACTPTSSATRALHDAPRSSARGRPTTEHTDADGVRALGSGTTSRLRLCRSLHGARVPPCAS